MISNSSKQDTCKEETLPAELERITVRTCQTKQWEDTTYCCIYFNLFCYAREAPLFMKMRVCVLAIFWEMREGSAECANVLEKARNAR
jgi:hypothetical protein